MTESAQRLSLREIFLRSDPIDGLRRAQSRNPDFCNLFAKPIQADFLTPGGGRRGAADRTADCGGFAAYAAKIRPAPTEW